MQGTDRCSPTPLPLTSPLTSAMAQQKSKWISITSNGYFSFSADAGVGRSLSTHACIAHGGMDCAILDTTVNLQGWEQMTSTWCALSEHLRRPSEHFSGGPWVSGLCFPNSNNFDNVLLCLVFLLLCLNLPNLSFLLPEVATQILRCYTSSYRTLCFA